MEVYTACPKCGSRFGWTMTPDVEAPDCPRCGFDATDREKRRKLREALRRFEGHTAGVLCVRFSPDGRTIASGGKDETVRLWDVDTREQVAELRRHSDYVNGVAFFPDGATLASVSG